MSFFIRSYYLFRGLAVSGCISYSVAAAPIEENLQGFSAIDESAIAKEQKSEERKFDIWEYRVEGAKLLSSREVERAVYPFLGPQKTIADIERAREALAEIYRKQGFVLANVSIPEQSINKGIVYLSVMEGSLSRIKISGNKYFSRKEIREQIPALVEGETPHLPTVQDQLSQLNRQSSDRQVIPILRPGPDEGTTEVELKVKDELPLHGGISWNGRNSPDTSRDRINAFLRYDNLWQRQHGIAFNYQVTPSDRDEVEVFGLNYTLPFFTKDGILALYAIDSSSDVATVGDIQVLGDGTILGIKAILPILSSDQFVQSLSFGVEEKDFGQTALLTSASQQDTPIDYTSLNADYTGTVRSEKSTLGFGAGVRMGLRGFGNSPGEFERKRAGSKNNFVYFVGKGSYDYRFDNEFQIRSRAQMQLTGDPLIGNEQYSAGGQTNVRGYLTSQELADEAYFASIEIWLPDFAQYIGLDLIDSLHVLSFLDYAKLHNKGTLPGEKANERLSGAGFGIRASFFEHLIIALDFARALSDSSEGSDAVDKGDHRTHFSIDAQF